jgi:D-glycero-D-manno-heptose 1,7-bisphosphate phosphatase
MKQVNALFLDRDGVVNEDFHYPHKPEDIQFRDGIFDLCRKALTKGYRIFVVTNQAGIAKGKFTEDDVRALHAWMSDEFKKQGIEIAAFYFCPYHKNATVPAYAVDSPNRKPKPGMFLQAAREHNIDFGVSLMIGDKPSDRIELPGLRSIIIKSEYTGNDYDVENLKDIENYL